MDEQSPRDWTEVEWQAIAELPREEQPPLAVRYRIAASLRTEGILDHAGPPRAWRAGVAVAIRYAAVASVCFVLGALAAGWQWSSPNVTPFLADGLEPAALVQQTGSAYVGALRRLGEAGLSADYEMLGQGREAALAGLRGAAGQMDRLPGIDVRTAAQLRQLRDQPASERGTDGPHMLWY